MTACGTAFYACMVGEVLVREAGAPAGRGRGRLGAALSRAAAAGGRRRASPSRSRARPIDTLAALRYAKAHKQTILSVVNVPESAIARESHVVLPTLAGPEIGVASTKAFTTQLTGAAGRGDRCRPRARHAVAGRGGAAGARPDRAAGAHQRGAEHGGAVPAHRRGYPRRGARRALHGPRLVLPDRAGRRAEAEGDLLHPRRGLCRRRDEARTDRADRRRRCRSSWWRRATPSSTRSPPTSSR